MVLKTTSIVSKKEKLYIRCLALHEKVAILAEELIDLEEAERVAKRYIRGKVRRGIEEIMIESGELTEIGGEPIYKIEGTVTVKSGVFKKEDKMFGVQIHAKSGRVLGFRMER